MGKEEILSRLLAVPAGTIIAWVLVIAGIIAGIATCTIKLFKLFENAHKLKDENDEFIKMVRNHDDQLKEIMVKLTSIQDNLDNHNKADLKKMRYSIVRAGEEYVSEGRITIRQLKSLEEMFDEYHDMHGNGYVATLMTKVRELPVIGKLDENDNDLE